MIEIIPSINAPSFEEAQELIARVDPYVSWCHLDVTDGVFSKHETWHDPRDLLLLKTKLKAEVHLMIEKPEKAVGQWLVEPVRRVITHLEAMTDPKEVIRMCREAGREIGFAIRPDTSVSLLDSWLAKVDMVLLLRVQPGASGQQMQSEMLGEITHVRNAYPGCTIEVDGGVTVDNAKRAVAAGASLLVAGASVFSQPDIGNAIEKLRS